MATVESCHVEANAIAARMARYDATARHALEDGDRVRWRYWLERALREQAELDAAKARLVEARRVETLRGGLRAVDVAPVAAARASASDDARSGSERRQRALIAQSRLVVGG